MTMSFVGTFTHQILLLSLKASVCLKHRQSHTLARPVSEKQASAFQLKLCRMWCTLKQTDTLDTWMFSAEVQMESHLVKPVTKSGAGNTTGSGVCIHINILYRCYYIYLKVETQPEGDLIGTSYIQANTLTTRPGFFWVTALSLPLLKPSHYSARSI